MNIKNWPKIDLHCHLDGSLNLDFVVKHAKRLNIELPAKDMEGLKEFFIATEISEDTAHHVSKFAFAGTLLQDEEALREASYELVKEAAEENVKYIEIRFAPLIHTLKGLNINQIVQSVIDGAKHAESEFDIKANIIICFRRSTDASKLIPVLDAAAPLLGKGLVAMDIVGFEVAGDVVKYAPIVEHAKKLGYKITFHGGEMTHPVPNVIDIIETIKPNRIGHAHLTYQDEKSEKALLESGLTIEMCPWSNSKRFQGNFELYPFMRWLNSGAKITLNTDNRRLSNARITENIELMIKEHNLTAEDYKKTYINSANAAFTDEKTKEWLLSLAKEIE